MNNNQEKTIDSVNMDRKIDPDSLLYRLHKRAQTAGNIFVDVVHYAILFLIGLIVVWASANEFFVIFTKGKAALKDILMMFIYLELIAMIGIYFKTHRLPAQFLIFIAITALSRHLVVDVQAVSDNYHLWLLATISVCILILSLSIVVLTWLSYRVGGDGDKEQVIPKVSIDKSNQPLNIDTNDKK